MSDVTLSPDVVVTQDAETMSRAAADRIIAALRAKPDLLLCTATGNSPQAAYTLVAAAAAGAKELCRQLRVLKLDEWGGLDADEAASCEGYLRRHLVGPAGLPTNQFHGFCCNPPAPAAECRRVSGWLREHGPIDLCVLGLGANGHLGFNEPAAFIQPFAHVATLSETSLTHGMLRDARHQPTYGMTLGMSEILAARCILLLVGGASKREPLARLLAPEVSPSFPASFLWLHPDVTILCDRAACPAPPCIGPS